MDLHLTDRVVLITGAGGGIGRALIEAFAAEGARLALHTHRQADALEQEIRARWDPERARVWGADIRDPEAVGAMVAAAAEHFGRLECAVINAGVWVAEARRLDEMPLAQLRDTLAVDLCGAIWTARAFLRALGKSGPHPDGAGASLAFIGSTAGRYGEAGHADYAVSKAGLYGLVRTLKNEIVELDPAGRVNMVEPGWTLTPMTRERLDDPQAITRTLRTMALRRIARAEDIARAVLFLSSPRAAPHVTGEILTVAGGMEGRVVWEPAQIDAAAVRQRLEDEP